MNMDNIMPHLVEYAEIKTSMKDMTARLKELDPVIRPMLVDKGVIEAGDHTFEVTMMKGRKTLDRKAMEMAGIDLEPYEKVGAPFTKLVVKEA